MGHANPAGLTNSSQIRRSASMSLAFPISPLQYGSSSASRLKKNANLYSIMLPTTELQ